MRNKGSGPRKATAQDPGQCIELPQHKAGILSRDAFGGYKKSFNDE
jgi:hypothetical protein